MLNSLLEHAQNLVDASKMAEHYPKATVEASAWCQVCHKNTMHRVDSGRLGACKDCIAKREQESERANLTRAVKSKQGELFK